MYDIIIVGAGPAGLTSAIYAARAHKKVLVLEASAYGGQIVTTPSIENYPAISNISGYDFATNIYNQALESGAKVKFEKVIDVVNYDDKKEVVTNKKTYEAKAVILATGSDNRKLGVDREDYFAGKGISYCATCDGNFYKKKVVAVVGGGNTALEEALYLTDICKKVYLIHRRDSFRGEATLVRKLNKKDNVQIIYNSNVTRLIGRSKLEAIEITDNDDKKERLDVSGLFIAVGRIPENQGFGKLIDLNENGYVIASEDCHTNVDGLFVAGDNRVKQVRQLVTAESDGAVAALEAIKYINNFEDNKKE
ncbi:MAG: thioredoxin-disulfide reductase [Bacilli bacterium]|nr:thioredoxin-disulfide reductase [Bacilli bacterium]